MISIDPGKSSLGWAVWIDRTLYQCSFVSGQFSQVTNELPRTLGPAYVEKMIHARSRSGSVAQDLIDVTAFGNAVAGRVSGGAIHYLTREEWGGGVPTEIIDLETKEVTGGLRPRIFSLLSDREKVIFGNALEKAKKKAHNVVDAVGIGLYALGRMGRGGTKR